MFVQLSVLVLGGLVGPLLALGRRGLVPVVVGELAAGVVLGHTGVGVLDPTASPLPVFKNIGFAMLMLSAGAHVDVASPAIRRGFLSGLAAFATVAVVAVPAGLLVDRGVGLGHAALLVVLIAGSSAAIAFPILEERGIAGDHIAVLIAWVALADSLTVVVMPLTLAGSTNLGAALGGDAAIIAAGAAMLVLLPRMRDDATRAAVEESRTRGWALQLRLSLLLLVGLSAIAERTGASTLVAGFVAGMILVHLREPDRLTLQLAGVGAGFFVPMFFVLLGAEIDLRALASSPSRLLLAGALVVAAIAVHLAGAVVGVRRARLATGMAASAQLGMPAAAASLGLSSHLLSPADAAALVAAGCLTLIPATAGSLLLARDASAQPATATPPSSSPAR